MMIGFEAPRVLQIEAPTPALVTPTVVPTQAPVAPTPTLVPTQAPVAPVAAAPVASGPAPIATAPIAPKPAPVANVQTALSARCLADDTTLFENNPGLSNARNLVQELESTYIDDCFSGIGSGSSCTISLDAVDDTYQNECTAAGGSYLVCNYIMFCSSFGLSFDFTHVPECWASSCQDGNLESYTDLLYRDVANDLNLSLDAECVIDTNDVNCAVANRAPPIVTDPEEAIVESSAAAVSYGLFGSLAFVWSAIVAASFH